MRHRRPVDPYVTAHEIELKNISVIPTCVDLDAFRSGFNHPVGPIKIAYVGTVVGWYDFEKTAKVLSLIGEELDAAYIAGLSGKVHKLVGKKVNTQVMTEIKDEMVSGSLLVWEVSTKDDFPVASSGKQQRKTKEGHANEQ